MIYKLTAIVFMIVAAALFIVGCEGEKGPAGPSGTADCIQCHSDNTLIVAVADQWGNSVHATGGNFVRNTPPCSGCHTSEGFVQKLATGDPGTQVNPSPIGCFTCHEPHTNHNFNLRTEAAVALMQGGGTFDMGAGNLCANCHQARIPDPPVSPTADITITSTHWGPHDGPQSNILSGNGAFVFGGATYGNSAHTTAVTDGCPTCHMATPYGTLAGGHSMNLTYLSRGSTRYLTAGCLIAGCHSAMPDFNKDEVQDSVETLFAVLEEALIAANVLDTTGTLNIPSGGSLTMTPDQAGAAYNYFFFEADRSLGVHNTAYTFDALNASLAALAGK